eukprot:scaffold195203_cov26-Tisochrysis_lutea.AAC.1
MTSFLMKAQDSLKGGGSKRKQWCWVCLRSPHPLQGGVPCGRKAHHLCALLILLSTRFMEYYADVPRI